MPLWVDDPGDTLLLPRAVEGMRSYANAAGARAFNEYSEAELREIVRAYYAMTTMVDAEIGRILARLDAAGLTDNTLVVLTSDHGELLTDHRLLLKGPALYDSSIRVPLVLRWPDRFTAARRSSLVSLVDLPATILAAAGCAGPTWQDGRSLLEPAVEGDESWPRDWALCQYRDSGRPDDPPVQATMLRRVNHKLIVYHGEPATDRPREVQLFDLADDPGERRNLAHDPAAAGILVDLLGAAVDVQVLIEDRNSPREAPW